MISSDSTCHDNHSGYRLFFEWARLVAGPCVVKFHDQISPVPWFHGLCWYQKNQCCCQTKKGCPFWTAFFGKGKKDEKTNWRLVENLFMQRVCQKTVEKNNYGTYHGEMPVRKGSEKNKKTKTKDIYCTNPTILACFANHGFKKFMILNFWQTLDQNLP
ncbi:MAG TPA: hypothetical protein VJ943_12950 [Desulfotignum sp.]|nr:hypothetical protein [Desulfotignum sp.]